jgi:hypothetical protein
MRRSMCRIDDSGSSFIVTWSYDYRAWQSSAASNAAAAAAGFASPSAYFDLLAAGREQRRRREDLGHAQRLAQHRQRPQVRVGGGEPNGSTGALDASAILAI